MCNIVLAGPPKVKGVMFRKNIVKNGKIHQEIKWNVPVLRHNAYPKYIIKYADNHKDILKRHTQHSSESNATLQLTFYRSNITYYVAVAVKSTKEQKRGDYSDPVRITYTSEFMWG